MIRVAFLCGVVLVAVSAVSAGSVYFQTGLGWQASWSGDSLGTTPVWGEQSQSTWYSCTAGTVHNVDVVSVSAGPVNSLYSESTAFLDVNSATNTATVSHLAKGTAGDSAYARVRPDQPWDRRTPRVSLSRSVTNTVFADGSDTLNTHVTLNVTANQSLAGLNSLIVYPTTDWDMPDGYQVAAVTNPTASAGFTYNGSTFVHDDTSTVTPGQSYTLEYDLQLTRSNTTGAAYLKAPVHASLYNGVGASSTGTEATVTLSDGSTTTVRTTDAGTDFYSLHMQNEESLYLKGAASAVGAPTTTAIQMFRQQEKGLDGAIRPGVQVSVKGANFVSGTIQTPDGDVLPMEWDGSDSMDVELYGLSNAQAATFADGTYVITIVGSDGSTVTHNIPVSSGSFPEFPVVTGPGSNTTDRTPTLSWNEPAVADFDAIYAMLEGNGEEYSQFLGIEAREWTPTGPLSCGGYVTEVLFAKGEEHTIGGVPVTFIMYSATEGYVNIRPIGGDATLDGTVSLNDLSTLAGHWGESNVGWTEGDFNRDGLVGLADLSTLAGHWGDTATVPEPASLVVLALGAASLLSRSRRRI